MDAILFIGFHVVMMAVFFILGVYQFSQIDDTHKYKRIDRLRSALPISELDIDETELRELIRAERYTDARHRLMTVADVDKFTAQSIIDTLKKQEYRPYHTSDD